jgi:UDP-N-acetylglucosamine 2-epimerase (non-hydrolysing)
MGRRFRLLTLLGIRPDIIRMHRLLRLLDQGQAKHRYQHLYAHSGQHFDYQLDRVFHRQLGVRSPDVNLRVGRTLKRSGKTGHVHQAALLFQGTARMLERLRPDAVLYLGDTNTVLSSIVVAKYSIPVIHIEGGGRSYDWRMPEEKNRIIIDHLSDLIFCYLDRYKRILVSEGVPEFRVKTVGNIIADALHKFLPVARENRILQRLGLKEKQYVLCTLHREENIDNAEILREKLRGLRELSKTLPVILPLMPRLKARISKFGFRRILADAQIVLTDPLGFLEFLLLEEKARVIVTDSGTVQEEALMLGVPCLVTRRSTERPETIAAGATILADEHLCANAHKAMQMPTNWDRTILNPAGGSPSDRIFEDLMERVRSGYFQNNRSLQKLKRDHFVQQAFGLARCAL